MKRAWLISLSSKSLFTYIDSDLKIGVTKNFPTSKISEFELSLVLKQISWNIRGTFFDWLVLLFITDISKYSFLSSPITPTTSISWPFRKIVPFKLQFFLTNNTSFSLIGSTCLQESFKYVDDLLNSIYLIWLLRSETTLFDKDTIITSLEIFPPVTS